VIRLLEPTAVVVDSVIRTRTEVTYRLDRVELRQDLNLRWYQPSQATVISRDNIPTEVIVSGSVCKGIFTGCQTSVTYQITDGNAVSDGRVEHQAPYWVQLLAEHRPTAPPVRIVWLNDDNVDIYHGAALLVSANYDNDGSAGMDIAIKTARGFAKQLGVPVTVEGSANSNA
jgi:hypothetical protein